MFSGLLAALALIAVYLYAQNNWLQLSRYALKADLEKPMTIVQLSDLHNARFGEAQARLMDMVRAQSPDAIVITGDLIDDTKGDDAPALELARGCAAIAPTYFVTGNHEKLSRSYEDFLPELEKTGVINLSGRTVTLENGATLTGAQDAGFIGRENYAGYVASLAPEADGYHILLAHRPEFVASYAAAGFDLAICGHAHGGQIRLPFIGGLYAPGQGKLPRYTAGLYDAGDITMLVSRGLGNSVFPFRVNNRPEVVVLTLEQGDRQPEAGL